jgi:putative endonuclease
MAGLVPAIHAFAAPVASRTVAQMRGGWVYIMTNRPSGTLYTGVTTDIARSAHEDITAVNQRESNTKLGRARGKFA